MTFAQVTKHVFVWEGDAFTVEHVGRAAAIIEEDVSPELHVTLTGGRVTEWELGRVPHRGKTAEDMDQHFKLLAEARRVMHALQGDIFAE